MINTIHLIVHPLYEQTYPLDDINGERRSPSVQARIITQNELHNYGLKVLEAQKNPQSILILVQQRFRKGSAFERSYNRFVKWAQASLGERFLFADFSFGTRSATGKWKEHAAQLEKELEKIPLGKVVTINYTGQYGDGCAKRSAHRLLHILAKKHGVMLETRDCCRMADELNEQLEEANLGKLQRYRKWKKAVLGKRRTIKKPIGTR